MSNRQFCFPIKIQLEHRNYLLCVLISLYILSTVLVISFLSGWLLVSCLTINLVMFRLHYDGQLVISRYSALTADHKGQWFLTKPDGQRSTVTMVCIYFVGPMMLFRCMRFRSACFWLTLESQQSKAQWHRMRVFKHFYLS